MKRNAFLLVVLFIIFIPLVYLGVVYNSLPSTVATHFSLNGQPDDYSNKSTFVFLVVFLLVMAVGVYLLLTNLEVIDPKKAVNQSRETMQKMGLAIVVLLSALAVIIIYSAINNSFSLNKVMLPVLGLFFAYLGNLMYNVKPNYFVGIRTPWTLEDEDTWRKTHRLAGKLWFAGGIVITILTLSIQPAYAVITMLLVTGVITIIPVVYSYRYFTSHKKQ
jgi:uncharacterized membrane protein